jgi:hypothetical protein
MRNVGTMKACFPRWSVECSIREMLLDSDDDMCTVGADHEATHPISLHSQNPAASGR